LGPPEPLKSLEVGQSVNAFRSVVVTPSSPDDNDDEQHQEDEQRIDFTIERVANTPNIYVLRSFVTPFECEQIQTLAKERGMKMAETITKNDTKSRKNCSVAWLPSAGPDASSIVSGLVTSTANIFLSNSVKSHTTAGVEDLQVLKYDIGGEFVHHHDGDCRILTVIYYINGVGGTWFPLADEDCASGTNNNNLPKNKAKALELAEDLVPGEHGILLTGSGGGGDSGTRAVRVNKGDAAAFYNYLDEGSAQLDWTALHCGLPSEKDETKWIANHWYRLNVLASY
jgi:hypothetical protein